ncbi:hypothetical protein HIM_08703 [Hirsutella minnesotensis 3608]|uniref:ASX DEUBAD domain-containing protein n=1 Tax=Hirsutella minnesotensis 3608 TaxID=1043627 RepID=A0A0F7ZSS2_9HYPO|nr:hypothetical protein HIM_08703 [Hirsutella minnesotensis 3608]
MPGVSKKKAPARKTRMSPDKLLTSLRSPLAKADLKAIFSKPLTWTALAVNEQAEILSLFPDSRHIIKGGVDFLDMPDLDALMNDKGFRDDCAAYKSNLADGRHDAGWLAEAWAAHEMRKAGQYDAYLRAKFEDDWGVKIPEETQEPRISEGEPDRKPTTDLGL